MPNISPPNISCMGSMLQYTGKHATVCTTGGPKPYRTLESPCSKDHQLVPPHYHMIDYLMVIANTSKFPQRTLQILLVYPRYIHHSEPRIQSGSTSPRTCMMEVRLAESYPYARCRTDDSCDTQTDPWTRPKRHYNRTKRSVWRAAKEAFDGGPCGAAAGGHGRAGWARCAAASSAARRMTPRRKSSTSSGSEDGSSGRRQRDHLGALLAEQPMLWMSSPGGRTRSQPFSSAPLDLC